jgi:hypothetical protein
MPSTPEQPSAPSRGGYEFVDWKSTLVSVIPADAGIQAVFELEPKRTLMPVFTGMTTTH